MPFEGITLGCEYVFFLDAVNIVFELLYDISRYPHFLLHKVKKPNFFKKVLKVAFYN